MAKGFHHSSFPVELRDFALFCRSEARLEKSETNKVSDCGLTYGSVVQFLVIRAHKNYIWLYY